jgi:hypothetical protein
MILTSGELASELGVSSQPWLSKAYLSPMMAQGDIAQTLPKKPKSPLQRYRLLRKGKDALAYIIYSKTYTEGSDPFAHKVLF